MSDARRYAVWPEPRSRSRSLKGSRPSVPHGTNFFYLFSRNICKGPNGHYHVHNTPVLSIFHVQVQSCIVNCSFKSWQTIKINNRRRQTVPHGHNSFSRIMLTCVYAAVIHRQLVRISLPLVTSFTQRRPIVKKNLRESNQLHQTK